MSFSSNGYYVDVKLVNGTFYNNVILCPDPFDKNITLLEYSNGDVVRVYSTEIDDIIQ